MRVSDNSLCFTQMIEFEVPPARQHALAQALVLRSEHLAQQHNGLLAASIQASDDGSRVLQYLQWQSRSAWQTAVSSFEQEPFLQLMRQHQAKGVNFNAFQTLSSLARTAEHGLHCQLPMGSGIPG
ncbi:MULTISPECIES: antibiotic biosynthesis monooxygenase [Pseudomonas]|uniref:ABM domain-containing protein n=1 Tax=Pseudomonas fluorescens TaxID=294 RepID=A0A5E6XG35_PSEFL|nr:MULTISPECIES: antibiotic biosynthesis monooxygenase [Pseudomonas]VVN39609.1 hypothetical protein PS652_05342 [Pseudomonas fluorescens]